MQNSSRQTDPTTAKSSATWAVITGASRIGQLQSNLGALAVIDKLTPEVMARIDAVTAPLAA